VPIEEARAAHAAETERLSGEGEPVAEVRDLTVPSAGGELLVRTFRPGDPHGVVAYLHGGGWVMGGVDTYDAPLRALANASGALVAGIEYRLAP
jgi:acetyl esterase